MFLFHTGSIKRPCPSQYRSSSVSFLFHTGSIKSFAVPIAPSATVPGFYSILVRLKGSWIPSRSKITYQFLFHTGSIKSVVGVQHTHLAVKFLFHTGSIKRKKIATARRAKTGFYSILVRLKVYILITVPTLRCLVSIPYWFD